MHALALTEQTALGHNHRSGGHQDQIPSRAPVWIPVGFGGVEKGAVGGWCGTEWDGLGVGAGWGWDGMG